MSRIGIMSYYDAEGIVDESVVYYIKSLKSVVSRLVVVVNGNIDDKGKEKLDWIADEILIRENVGFDAGAYKAVLCSPDFMEKIKQYDEIVLSNDTCFGPFIPFNQIFNEMECKDIDFWGIGYWENNIADCLQSNFLVFKANTYRRLQEYFQGYINEHEKDIKNVYAQFETGLFYYMKYQRFRFGYYRKINIDPYKSPNYVLSDDTLPVMKKKCFEKQKYIQGNCIGALKYILQNFDYDIKLILDTAWRKYKVAYDLEKELSGKLTQEKYTLWIADIDYDTIKKFCLLNKEIYIYGTGIMARKLFWLYQMYMNKFLGFIVSDSESKEVCLYDYPVYSMSEIDELDAPVLVGLNEENTNEVRKSLQMYTTCLFLFKADS